MSEIALVEDHKKSHYKEKYGDTFAVVESVTLADCLYYRENSKAIFKGDVIYPTHLNGHVVYFVIGSPGSVKCDVGIKLAVHKNCFERSIDDIKDRIKKDIDNMLKVIPIKDYIKNEPNGKVPDRRSDLTRVKSFVYANVKYINDRQNFITLRLLEIEDENRISKKMIAALNFIDHMYFNKNPQKKQKTATAMYIASEKYHLPIEQVRQCYNSRINVRRGAGNFWDKHKNGQ